MDLTGFLDGDFEYENTQDVSGNSFLTKIFCCFLNTEFTHVTNKGRHGPSETSDFVRNKNTKNKVVSVVDSTAGDDDVLTECLFPILQNHWDYIEELQLLDVAVVDNEVLNQTLSHVAKQLKKLELKFKAWRLDDSRLDARYNPQVMPTQSFCIRFPVFPKLVHLRIYKTMNDKVSFSFKNEFMTGYVDYPTNFPTLTTLDFPAGLFLWVFQLESDELVRSFLPRVYFGNQHSDNCDLQICQTVKVLNCTVDRVSIYSGNGKTRHVYENEEELLQNWVQRLTECFPNATSSFFEAVRKKNWDAIGSLEASSP